MQKLVTDFLEALRFLTVLPGPSYERQVFGDCLAHATLFFPLVGFVIGLISFACFWFFTLFLPEHIATFALIIVPILLSGGLHLDGFADFWDGFFHTERKEVLRIMKDARIGSWAACAVTLLLFAKFELLQILPQKIPVFLFALAASRWAQVVLSFYLPYAGGEKGLGLAVAQRIGWRELGGATLCLVIFIFILKINFFIFFGLLFFLALLGLAFKRKLGGVTGDLLGAASEMSELFIYLIAVASPPKVFL